ncbi:MAG: HAD-IIB family hydrolase [Nitrospiraceae bacterium]
MHFVAVAADYDGTLAQDGRVADRTAAALERLLASGRKLILVTGRELDDLLAIFPHITLCERVIAENGALLYRPSTGETKHLGLTPPPMFVAMLRARGVHPLSVGRSIVATIHPHETTVLETIRDVGLELQVIFNKGSVMVLPAGVNKATGLMAALDEMGISPHNVAAIGDGENDHALLRVAEYSVAVANAVPMLKEFADRMSDRDHGEGVIELIEDLIDGDLESSMHRVDRHRILVGTREDGEEVRFHPFGLTMLVAGSSGSGKSTLATGILERLAESGFQFCIVDPEGDYEAFDRAVILGNGQRAPSVEEVLAVLEKPDANVVVNLVGLPLEDRPRFFLGLLPRLQELRAKTGRPHWILVDETHHLLPTGWEPAPSVLTQRLSGLMLVTVHPDQVAPSILKGVDIAITLGEAPDDTLLTFAQAVGELPPVVEGTVVDSGQALLWLRRSKAPAFSLTIAPCKMERRRHLRKYAEGELPPDRSFYFRGPKEALNLRAQNLVIFMQIADGVDDATWVHHLRQGDYSRWLRDAIKDEELAELIGEVERREGISPNDSRSSIRAAIEQHYTLPAREPA